MPAAETDYLMELEEADQPESHGALVRSQKLHRIERRNRILKLRRDGLTYDQISLALSRGDDGGEAFDISADACKGAVQRYVANMTREDKESVETLRLIDNERLERMFARLESDRLLAQRAKDYKAEDRIIARQLAVMERHAKLNGLDAPTIHRHEGDVNVHHIAAAAEVKQVESEWDERFGATTIEAPPDSVREIEAGDEEPAD